MFKASYNTSTEKGTTQFLLQKRNKQFSALFKKLRDPINILHFYQAIRVVYISYFGDEQKAQLWLKILIHVLDKGFFWQSDLKEKFGLTQEQADSVLKRMGKRNLLNIDRSNRLYLYSLSADGHLFVKNFKRDCSAAMVKVVKESRSGNKKIFTTKKVKKNETAKGASTRGI